MENETQKDIPKKISIVQAINDCLNQPEGWHFTNPFPFPVDTVESEDPVTEDAEFEIIQPKQLKQ